MAGRNDRPRAYDRGFTLVELLIALSLVGVILGLVGSIFLWGHRHVGRTVNTFDLQTDGYTVLREITAGFDLPDKGRQPGLIAARSVEFSADAFTRRLQYTLGTGAAGATVSYDWSPQTGALTREVEDYTPQTVLVNVEAFDICLDGALLKVELSQRSERAFRSRAASVARVYPRNARPSNISVPEC